jgi:hypothetical protein
MQPDGWVGVRGKVGPNQVKKFSIVFAPYSIDMHVLDTVWMVGVNFYPKQMICPTICLY